MQFLANLNNNIYLYQNKKYINNSLSKELSIKLNLRKIDFV